MIIIKLIFENSFAKPERELTDNEKKTVTSALFNGVEAIYYQGDEPKIEENL